MTVSHLNDSCTNYQFYREFNKLHVYLKPVLAIFALMAALGAIAFSFLILYVSCLRVSKIKSEF
jgi:hypothetical protein